MKVLHVVETELPEPSARPRVAAGRAWDGGEELHHPRLAMLEPPNEMDEWPSVRTSVSMNAHCSEMLVTEDNTPVLVHRAARTIRKNLAAVKTVAEKN